MTSSSRGPFEVLRIATLCADARGTLELIEGLLPDGLPSTSGAPIPEGKAFVLGAGQVGDIEINAELLLRDVTELHSLTAIPTRDIVITQDSLADDAAAKLAAGIADETAVFLAASLLTPSRGWPALANSLRLRRAPYKRWAGVHVGDLLAAFRGATADQVQHVLDDIDVDPSTQFPDLDESAAWRLAQAIEEPEGEDT
jgi:hypothetical protein